MKLKNFLAPVLLVGIIVSCTQQTSTDRSTADLSAADPVNDRLK